MAVLSQVTQEYPSSSNKNLNTYNKELFNNASFTKLGGFSSQLHTDFVSVQHLFQGMQGKQCPLQPPDGRRCPMQMLQRKGLFYPDSFTPVT